MPEVEIIRSAKRKRTISARLVDGKIQVRVPATLSMQEEEKAVADIVARVMKKNATSAQTDEELTRRAEYLNTKYLAGKATVGSIRWVTNQRKRWGSCTIATGDIRISHRLQDVPDYVLDSVIIHELVHTFIHTGHSQEFWEWADRAPKAERAKGFLEAFQRIT
ncbi:M48 metallopeptidase family protein [Corynebacterium sp. ZY180755]